MNDFPQNPFQILVPNIRWAPSQEGLQEKALEQHRVYYKVYKPGGFLFEGQFGGSYSTRSIQTLFRKALKPCGINKKTHGSYSETLISSTFA